MLRSLVLAAVLASSGAWQGTAPAPTPAAPTYDAKYTDADGQVYTGTVTFSVDAKGVVTGKMRLTDPIEVLATVSGTVKGGKWTFEYPYEIPAQGCAGSVKGTGDVSADSKTIQGSATAGCDCSEQPIQLTFTLTRQAK
jgi:hypothetical protein